MLTQQELLVSELMGIMTSILNSKDDRPKKVRYSDSCVGMDGISTHSQIEKLRNTLSSKKNLLEFRRPIRLPLDPGVTVTGILADNASIFKSALTPAKLGFKTKDGNIYWVCISTLNCLLAADELRAHPNFDA